MDPEDSFLRTAYAPVDEPHEELERCVRALKDAVRSSRADETRKRFRTIIRRLGEHFADEEAMMERLGWSLAARHAESHVRLLYQVNRLETYLAGRGLTPDFASWALNGLPEILAHGAPPGEGRRPSMPEG